MTCCRLALPRSEYCYENRHICHTNYYNSDPYKADITVVSVHLTQQQMFNQTISAVLAPTHIPSVVCLSPFCMSKGTGSKRRPHSPVSLVRETFRSERNFLPLICILGCETEITEWGLFPLLGVSPSVTGRKEQKMVQGGGQAPVALYCSRLCIM